jgi:hypothetical protein
MFGSKPVPKAENLDTRGQKRAVAYSTGAEVGSISYPSTVLMFDVQKCTYLSDGEAAHMQPRSRNPIFP